jgi:glutamyl-tRNA synthetase
MPQSHKSIAHTAPHRTAPRHITMEEAKKAVEAKAEEIRALKASGAAKDALAPLIKDLLDLKEKFKELNGGVPFDPPPQDKKKNKKKEEGDAGGADANGPKSEGPSKKELAKLEKKAKKAAAKAVAAGGDGSPAVAVGGGASGAPAAAAAAAPGTTLRFCDGALPVLAMQSYLLVKATGVPLQKVEDLGSRPCLILPDGRSVSGDRAIARYFARAAGRHDLLGGDDAVAASLVDQWLDVSASLNAEELAGPVESTLASSAFLAAPFLTLADIAVYSVLYAAAADAAVAALPEKGKGKGGGKKPAATPPNTARWMAAVEPVGAKMAVEKGRNLIRSASSSSPEAVKGAEKVPGKKSGKTTGVVTTGAMPDLEDGVEGQVVVRFPPEPSGYLHIGHVKACLTNEYYAKRYKGKLLLRFDDTNPSKEKDEYDESIVQDLQRLGVVPHSQSRTSDHFDKLRELAEQSIKDGWSYMDNTPQEQMQAERLERKESANRNNSVEDNLRLFQLMCEGDPEGGEYCLRAKIDMQSNNGCMRDPVIYRQNLTPHLCTGTKYKAYPTYDFACPVVDSLEGVTHAMRTTEYNDRDEQFHWFIAKMKLRPVKIQSFARLNFVKTVLSKRKLNWFVEQGMVDGWFDPRFPTVQGVLRRGLRVEALREFILSQGASRRLINMEWDKFWSSNKSYYEVNSPRYMGVFADTAVELTITNMEEGSAGTTRAISVQLHPKNKEMGFRPVRLGRTALLEGPDAQLLQVDEVVRLKYFAAVKITNVEKDASGKVIAVKGTYDEGAPVIKGQRILNWLAKNDDILGAQLVEFDHLITKDKLDENDKFEDFVNPNTKAETKAWVDPCLRTLQVNDVIQLERRGFFRVDEPYQSPTKPLVLFMIPDGKTKAMSTLSSALVHA